MVNENSDSSRTTTRASVPQTQRKWLDLYRSWKRFHLGVRRKQLPLLKSLSRYPRCVLVAGCQRSGTTMLTRLIAGAPDFTRLKLTADDELDAALALAGFIDLPTDRRYCFQTTYLNECYGEYRTLGPDQRLIWVLRNPYSVVYSMLYNWRRFALNELYEGCGVQTATSERLRRSRLPWPFGPSRLEKACLAYRGKVAQILTIRQMLRSEQLLIVDYDQLIGSPAQLLPRIFAFAGAPYKSEYAQLIQGHSAAKADHLSGRARRQIAEFALPVFRETTAAAAEHCAT